MVPSGDERGLATVQAALDDYLRHCLALGGRPYLYGAHRLDRAAADATYGPDYERLRALQQALDPSGLLRSEVLP